MDTAPDFIPDDQFKPDDEKPKEAPDFVADKDFIPDNQSASASTVPDFIPDDEFVEDEPRKSVLANQPGNSKYEKAMSLAMAPNPDPWVQQQVGQAGPSSIMGMPGAGLASFGARGIRGAIESGAIQAKDEIDKANLGQGDPTPAVAAKIAGAGALGFLVGGITGQRPESATEALKVIHDSKIGSHFSDMLKGVGAHLQFLGPEQSKLIPEDVKSKAMFKVGQVVAAAIHGKGLSTVLGAATGHLEPGLIGDAVSSAIKFMFGEKLSAASRKTLAPMILKAASSEAVKNPSQILEHAKDITRGDTAISRAVESVFATGAQNAFDGVVSDKDKDKIKDQIENSNPILGDEPENTQGYAKGGDVKAHHEDNNEIANHWPEQNMMLQAAKTRVHGYLNSVRPLPSATKLPFDTEHKDKQKQRDYDKAIHLAAQPLSIMNHIKDGSLTPKQLKAFNTMYPEVHQELSKRMTAKILQHQLDGSKKPSYKTRQALSMFLGTSLDSTLTPMGIQTAQAVFSNQNAQKQMPKSNTGLSKIASNYMSDDQAREKRLNK